MPSQCLAGLRVLDLTQYIPGPFATQWLSDLGATVIKVEPPAGDPMRTMGPVDTDGSTVFYKLANRNKTVIRLDLKTDDGRNTFAQLLTDADVLVEAYRPGVLDRLGFGPDRLSAINSHLIHCSLSGYGQTGPQAPVAGHDLTYVALTGGLWASGTADRPVMTFPPLADHAGAMAVVMAVLAALVRRGTTGQGARLDVSLAEAALSWMGGILTEAARGTTARRESDLINGGAAFYRIYRTRDGKFLAVAALEAKFWEKFCMAVGHEDWITRQAEPMPQNLLIAHMEELFLTRDRDDWMALLGPQDCCIEPVLEPGEVTAHPHWQSRGLIQSHPGGMVEVLLPMLMNGVAPQPRRPHQDVDTSTALAQWARHS